MFSNCTQNIGLLRSEFGVKFQGFEVCEVQFAMPHVQMFVLISVLKKQIKFYKRNTLTRSGTELWINRLARLMCWTWIFMIYLQIDSQRIVNLYANYLRFGHSLHVSKTVLAKEWNKGIEEMKTKRHEFVIWNPTSVNWMHAEDIKSLSKKIVI
jgi:hypothetical protein